jgi:hypothetical protein
MPTRRNDEKQNLPPSEQSESKLPRNELTLIKKLPQQIKIKTHSDKTESRESIKQIQSQIAQLQTHVTKIGNAVDNAFANIKSKKKGKKKGKKYKKK